MPIDNNINYNSKLNTKLDSRPRAQVIGKIRNTLIGIISLSIVSIVPVNSYSRSIPEPQPSTGNYFDKIETQEKPKKNEEEIEKEILEKEARFKRLVKIKWPELKKELEQYSDEEIVKMIESLRDINYDILDIMRSDIKKDLKGKSSLRPDQIRLFIDIAGDYGLESTSKIESVLKKKELEKEDVEFLLQELKQILVYTTNGMDNSIFLRKYVDENGIEHVKIINVEKRENLSETIKGYIKTQF